MKFRYKSLNYQLNLKADEKVAVNLITPLSLKSGNIYNFSELFSDLVCSNLG